jgi:hypothetical protein
MTQFITTLSELGSNYPYLIYSLVIILVYLLYRVYFKGIIFSTRGDYDAKRKNIGNPLPPYPNGWYVACRTSDLLKGNSLPVDIAGENIVVFRSEKG